MAVGLQLTLAGALLLSKAIAGKKLEFTHGGIGNAKVNDKLVIPTQEQMDNLNALLNQKMVVPIAGYEFKGNGDIGVTVRVKNDSVPSDFRMREIGLFAKDPDTGGEVLYAYYFDSVGDTMHAKNSYVVLEYYLELITTIANATNVTCNVVVVDKIKPGIGLSRNVDTINVNCGDGISVVDNKLTAQKYSLPTASSTVKGGIMIGKNFTLTGDSLNAADPYTLPTGSETVKGGFKVGKNLYLTGDSLNSAAEPYDDSLLNSRLNQLEINLSNAFMKLNADEQLGITANLLLVEDFKECDTLSLGKKPVNNIVSDATYHNKGVNIMDNLSGFNIGYSVTFVQGHLSCNETITDIRHSKSGDDYFYRLKFEGESGELAEMDGASKPPITMYRSTVAIKDGVAYGPSKCDSIPSSGSYTWEGENKITSHPATLNTTAGQESNFDLTGECSLTSDGFFTLS